MNATDAALYDELRQQLFLFNQNIISLPGIAGTGACDAFVRQLVDSVRRVKYVFAISAGDVSQNRVDPASEHFDPLKAAIIFNREGMINESCWLVFLAINHGKHLRHGWKMTRDIYGGLGRAGCWSWDRVSNNLSSFKQWIADNHSLVGGGFGNHRKYESLRPDSNRSPGAVVESYVNWVRPLGGHEELFRAAENEVGDAPRDMFDFLYKSMGCVLSFGRTAKFDYLTMLGKLGLAPIEPGSTFMERSTGPIKGARLLFGGNSNAGINHSELEVMLAKLEAELSLGRMAMQVLEDALCNWQKSQNAYKRFRG